MATWPADVPSPFADSQPTINHADGAIRSKMEVGPAKVRPRFTGKLKTLTYQIVLLPAQYTSFMAFYNANRYVAWDWIDLATGAFQRYRFAGPLKEVHEAGSTPGENWWRIEITVETV